MAYSPPTQPYSHQAEALRRIARRPRQPSDADAFALLMDMGTGKSKVILDEFGSRFEARELDNLFIVAPAGSYRNWTEDKGADEPSEIRKHMPADFRFRLATFAWRSGLGAGERRRLAAFLSPMSDPRIFTMNVEALNTKDAFDAAKRFLASGRTMLVVDESTVIKNSGAQRTQRLAELRELATARRIATGLIAPKSPMDIFSQFEFLDWRIIGHRTLTTFRARYAKTVKICMLPGSELQARWEAVKRRRGDVPLPPTILIKKFDEEFPPQTKRPAAFDAMAKMLEKAGVDTREPHGRQELIDTLGACGVYLPHIEKEVDYQNLDELQAKIAPYSFRVLKEDCLDLPPKVYAPIREVALDPEQKRQYDELRDFATTQLESGDHVTATQVVTLMMRLQQVLCGHVVDEEGKTHAIPSRRDDALSEILSDHSGKAIIWACHDYSIRGIAERLRKDFGPGSVAQFWGGNKSRRAEEERRFLSDPECRFMVATQAAGGRGNTWVNADLVIYYANNYDLEQRSQSEDRAHRAGQTKSVTYIDLAVPGSVDMRIIRALRAKINLATAVTGENYKEWLI